MNKDEAFKVAVKVLSKLMASDNANEEAIYALESFVVEDKPNKCFVGHHLPFKEAIKILKSLKERISL